MQVLVYEAIYKIHEFLISLEVTVIDPQVG